MIKKIGNNYNTNKNTSICSIYLLGSYKHFKIFDVQYLLGNKSQVYMDIHMSSSNMGHLLLSPSHSTISQEHIQTLIHT